MSDLNTDRWELTLNIGLHGLPNREDTARAISTQEITEGIAENAAHLLGAVEFATLRAAVFDNYSKPGEHPAGYFDSSAVTEPTLVVVFDVAHADFGAVVGVVHDHDTDHVADRNPSGWR